MTHARGGLTAALLVLLPGRLLAQSDGVVEEVLAYQQAATDAFLRNDATAIDSLLADDCTLTDSRGGISGRHDAAAAARARSVGPTPRVSR